MDYLWNNENKLYLPNVTHKRLRIITQRKTSRNLFPAFRNSKTFAIDDLTMFDVLNLMIGGDDYEKYNSFDNFSNRNFLYNLTEITKEFIKLRKYPRNITKTEHQLYSDLNSFFDIFYAQVEEYYRKKGDQATLFHPNPNIPSYLLLH